MYSAQDLIELPSTNTVENPLYISYTDKTWARGYHSIRNLAVHTFVDEGGVVHAPFEPAFLPLESDDKRRAREPAQIPNERFWRLETESDIENWWHTEVSHVVLAAWAKYPAIVQTCHTKPLSEVNISDNVDSTYAMYVGNTRVAMAIGEMKRNLITAKEWQAGNLSGAQEKLARELRGYADKYRCPQIFCWDGQTLLLLQFRARKPDHIRVADCVVDCWVLPAVGSSCSLRYALYRLMVQGLRRCQGESASILTVGSLREHDREFFTGRPIWKVNGQSTFAHPEGYSRKVDEGSGALVWSHENDPVIIWETAPLW